MCSVGDRGDPQETASGGPAFQVQLAIPDTGSPAPLKTSLLRPMSSDAAKEKNRQNTLTIMVEPFSHTIKNWKGRTGCPSGLSRHYDHDLHDDGCTSATCAGASPDGHYFPRRGRQGCTLIERQPCVDNQDPQCHAVVSSQTSRTCLLWAMLAPAPLARRGTMSSHSGRGPHTATPRSHSGSPRPRWSRQILPHQQQQPAPLLRKTYCASTMAR